MKQRLGRDVLRILASYSLEIALVVDELSSIGINKCIVCNTMRIRHDDKTGWIIDRYTGRLDCYKSITSSKNQVCFGFFVEKIDRLRVIRTKDVQALVECTVPLNILPVSFTLKGCETRLHGLLISDIQVIVYGH